MTIPGAATGAHRVGVFGYGNLGRFLCANLAAGKDDVHPMELAFVYNRDPRALTQLAASGIPTFSGDPGAALPQFLRNHPAPDLIAEVAHPVVIRDHGRQFLDCCDLFVASISALADPAVNATLLGAQAAGAHHGLYLPAGAAWGVEDVARMDRSGTLQGLSVTMTFHHAALKLDGALARKVAAYRDDAGALDPVEIYTGNVAELAALAPNNVNTMVCLALAASTVGSAGTGARLVAQKGTHTHLVEIEVRGPGGFVVHTRRVNPAKPGAVTGDQTYHAFLASLRAAHGRGAGIHFC